jgi:hypothetical protein
LQANRDAGRDAGQTDDGLGGSLFQTINDLLSERISNLNDDGEDKPSGDEAKDEGNADPHSGLDQIQKISEQMVPERPCKLGLSPSQNYNRKRSKEVENPRSNAARDG